MRRDWSWWFNQTHRPALSRHGLTNPFRITLRRAEKAHDVVPNRSDYGENQIPHWFSAARIRKRRHRSRSAESPIIVYSIGWFGTVDEADRATGATGDSLCTAGNITRCGKRKLFTRRMIRTGIRITILVKTTEGAVNWESSSPDCSVGEHRRSKKRALRTCARSRKEEEFNDMLVKDGGDKEPRSPWKRRDSQQLRRQTWKRE